MERKATEAIATVKDIATESMNGEFEIVMSTDSVDRDGEIIVRGAFDPLPTSIPVHAFHDFNDPIGRAVPGYNELGQLVGRGFYAGTARAQEIRQLVGEGIIAHTSVGFMAADRTKDGDGPPQIKSAELLEVSFVSVPSNRDARVLASKSHYERGTKAPGTFATGDRVKVTIDPSHMPGQSSGTVAEVGGTAYGVVFDDMPEMGVHRWYVAAELGVADAAPEMPTMSGRAAPSDQAKAPIDTTAPAAPSVVDGKQPASVVTRVRLAAARALLDTV